MEQWRAELQGAIDAELEECDGEFEEQFLQEMISNLDREVEPQRATARGGSIPGRKFMYRDQEASHNHFFVDYFSETPTPDQFMF
jgi:hypothetical protein